jgi:uncharacterized GH25 family protein
VVTIETPGGYSTRTADGWSRKPKNEESGAKSCSNYFRYGKEAFITGQAEYSGLAAKPAGQKLEFVPQTDPSRIRAGQPFPVKVYFNGQPLRGGVVSAYLAGMVKYNAALFFQAAADQEGLVNIIPLAAGDWLAKVSVEEPFPNKSVCDEINLPPATLSGLSNREKNLSFSVEAAQDPAASLAAAAFRRAAAASLIGHF